MKLIRKSVSVLLALLMVASLFTIVPLSANAAAAVEYIYRTWDGTQNKVVDHTETCSDYTTITSTSSALTLTSGWYVVNGGANITDHRITISGKVHLILLSGTMDCEYGIRLSKGNSLFVYPGKNSSGKLNAHTGSDEEANIGGDEGENCGEFVFYGGSLTAKNNDWCSGGTAIGGGGYGGNCGKLSFYGGTVDASNNGAAPGRKSYGAVIGDGSDAYSNDSDCYINIYGGTIKADNHACSNGSGIGGGEDSTGCPINILGGKITARAYNGAGIGSGQDGGSSTVTIKNATVEAESDYGAGIGSGEDSDAKAITIDNSYVTAVTKTNGGQTGAEGAGIGGGNCGKSTSIKINDSVITASSGRYGAGIGGGDERDGGDIEITESCVFAHSAQGGAGIGGGDEKGCGAITLKNSFVCAITDSEVNTAGKKFINDYGDYYNTIMYSISNPAVSEQAGWYAAGSLTAMTLAYLIEGTHTGAGIGGGDSGKADKIDIDNCTVMATAGECGAGIGGGDEGTFGEINIKNSNIYSHGGDYGAGIGTGDEAKKCGKIFIENSEVEADSASEGAAIGTGNEVDQTPTIEIKSSTVTANGGKYAAGIGGGDDTGGGNISIDNSTVHAYGGTDAAGIGGGEGGNGGHIKISSSNVYAKGKEYGAGIGGGEDSSGDYCGIYGNSTVEAVSGGDGNVQSIGHGDCGWYVTSYTGGTLSLDQSLTVKIGSDTYYNASRYDAIRHNKSVVISPCSHPQTTWLSINNLEHVRICDMCGSRASYPSDHKWDSNHVCTVCNAVAEYGTINLVEKDNNGEVQRRVQVLKQSYYKLPEPENVPDGMEFICWVSTKSYSGEDYHDYRSVRDGYNEIQVKDNEDTWYAWYLPLVDAVYIDNNGEERTVKARKLNGNMPYSYLTDGWYYVSDDTEIAKDFPELLELEGHIRLILADGKTMRYAGPSNSSSMAGDYLTVYGQSAQTGTLDLVDSPTNLIRSLKQVGGNIRVNDNVNARNLEIQGGSLYAKYYSLILTVTGGNVTIGKLYLANRNDKQIGWTEPTDSVRFDNIERINPKFTGTITIAEGQAFKDEAGNIYTGALTDDELNAIKGKTLTPYIEHDYNEPEWVWSSDYKDATAVFRCNDAGCGDVQKVKAKVTVKDENNIRTSNATCRFQGQTYTSSHTTKLHWNVSVENCAHGTVTVDESTAKAGEVIRLSVTPDEGYVLKSWSVTPDDDSQSVETGEFQFTMPASDVTVSAEFIKPVEKVEPYIDNDGEYHLGTVEHFELNGKNYAVAEDGSIGDELDSIDLSYFDFVLEGNTYRIKYYTGPYDNLTELVIPKTFNGKPITSLGTDSDDKFMQGSGSKPQFSLVLNENITEIKQYSFYTQDVKEVKGNTSGLNSIGSYAFSWGNSPDNFNIDIKLDYEGTITCGSYIFNHRNVTLRLKHSTHLNKTTLNNLGAQSVNYIFTDAHTYGDTEWEWADDYSSAKAAFTCTDSRCKHTEKVDAEVTKTDFREKTDYTATAEFENETYTDTQTVSKTLRNITVNGSNHGTVTADKAQAYEDETVNLTVTPDDGYKLTELTVKDSSNKEVEIKDNKFTMPKSAVTVSATFAARDYAISYSDYDDIWLWGPLYANAGEQVTVYAAPHSGYEITKLTYRDGAGDYHNIDIESKTFIMPASEIKIYATFRKANYTITYETDGHGTVTGASTAQFNDRVPLTVTPDEGYILNNFYAKDNEWGDPANIYNDNGYVLVMADADITVHAEFISYTPASEPYIDEQGEYHLGNVAYYDAGGGTYYAVEDGKLGEQLDSVELSYFDFTENGSTYQINYYTGPTENLTELVIPKTFKGKPITTLGTDNRNAFVPNSNPKPKFTLTLNENIREIKGYAFYTMWVKKVQGDTSNLRKIGDYAFSWANSPDDYKLDIKFDYEGTINAGYEMFNHMNVTARIKHVTKFSRSNFSQQSINYIFTDAHIYENPEWSWSDDLSSASAKFTCTDNRCARVENVGASVTREYKNNRDIYTAKADFEGTEYTDTKSFLFTKIADTDSSEIYKRGDEKFFSKTGANYTEITDSKTKEFLSLLDNPVDVNSVNDIIAAMNPEIAATGYIGSRLLGFQTKQLVDEQIKDNSLRFVTEMSCDMLNKLNNDAQADYGFVFAALNKNSTSPYNKLTVGHSAARKYSCKGTTNSVSLGYGDLNFDSTDYKYITAGVNDVPTDAKMAARFYITFNSENYYVNYANRDGVTGVVFNTNTALTGGYNNG